MATRWRLPEALGGGECTIKDRDQRYGPDRYVRATVGEGDEAITVDLLRGLLIEVTPPLPEEPPPGYYLLDHNANMCPIVAEHEAGYGWHIAGSADGHKWDEVVAMYPRATFTRLVPDPFAEPVALPWERKSGSPYVFIATDGGDGYLGLTVGPTENTADGYSVTADGARDMARALWAAADAADKEQS